jgi:hypothetical protein
MLLKLGVVISQLNPEIRGALAVIEDFHNSIASEAVITAGADGNHKVNSLHYHNDAVDVRLQGKIPHDTYVSSLQAKLGPKFFVLHEVDHYHVQYGGNNTTNASTKA